MSAVVHAADDIGCPVAARDGEGVEQAVGGRVGQLAVGGLHAGHGLEDGGRVHGGAVDGERGEVQAEL